MTENKNGLISLLLLHQAQQDEIWEAVRGILERLANIS